MANRYYVPNGKGGSTLAFVQSADVVGDQVVKITGNTITVSISTPRAKDGTIAISQLAVLNKAGTAILGMNYVPVVAKSSTSLPIRATGDSIAKDLQSTATLVGSTATALVGAKLIP